MPKGIYAAASAMVAETRAQEVTARNMAHQTTAGYRRETALRTSFAETLLQQGRDGGLAGDGGAGVLSAGSFFSFGDGIMEPTGAPLDLGLHGDGFYRVKDDQGRTLLTRVANFAADAQGRLVTPEGWTVEGQGGPIVIPPDAGQVRVDRDGRVSTLNRVGSTLTETIVDQLRLVTVDAPTRMTALNGQYFDPGAQAQRDATHIEVHQGHLERSNVDPLHEMVEMIATQRRYDAAQRALKEQASVGGSLSDLLRGNA